MSIRRIWIVGFSVFVVLMFVGLAGLVSAAASPIGERLAAAALERTLHHVRYDPSYVTIPYPMGDVPAGQGVCTDVIVRAYRRLGIDLQELVHEDMTAHFSAYPQEWGSPRPDTNIDHRRVPNLQAFFKRHGQILPVTLEADNYRPGDLVTWTVPPHFPHIGIISSRRSADGARPLIVHNIGLGPRLEDRLFEFPITGHYRYDGPGRLGNAAG